MANALLDEGQSPRTTVHRRLTGPKAKHTQGAAAGRDERWPLAGCVNLHGLAALSEGAYIRHWSAVSLPMCGPTHSFEQCGA